MTIRPEHFAEGWSLDLAEEIDLPGWVLLPAAVPEDYREPWAVEVAGAVLDLARELDPAAPPPNEAGIRDLLLEGLAARDRSDSELLYLVFPMAEDVALFCSVDLIDATELPALPQEGGRLYPADARYIGPGVQYSTRRVVEDDGIDLELSAVHFIFTDDEFGVIMSLGEAGSLAVSQSLIGFDLLKNALLLTRPDGRTLEAVMPLGLAPDSEWDTQTEEVS